jgi:DNA-binding transcriptional MerR regulator
MKALAIGQVARHAGVGIETVRFYERQGLLAEPERRASGYRQYDGEAVAVLRFIRRAKELGFTLKEIKGLLGLRLDTSATRADVRRHANVQDGVHRICGDGGDGGRHAGWHVDVAPARTRGLDVPETAICPQIRQQEDRE